MNPSTRDYSFTRYLAAKKSVDDRALNRPVWEALAHSLGELPDARPVRVLEVGMGIGTMLERMLEWGLLRRAGYTGIDAQVENVAAARARLPGWAGRHAFSAHESGGSLTLEGTGCQVTAELEAIDLFDLVRRETGRRRWDLLVAHAFLDLVDIPAALPQMFGLLEPGGRFYFTINFDGLTLLEPVIDPAFDRQVQELYHRTMDERITDGQPSGDSRAGRRLFGHLRSAGAQLLAAGASDWVVFPGPHGYPADEAYFLHFILHTLHGALRGRPELDQERFEGWIAERHNQVERRELVYIAHQLDFFGTWPGLSQNRPASE